MHSIISQGEINRRFIAKQYFTGYICEAIFLLFEIFI